MPSRMEKYYKSNDVKKRTSKNQDLYKTIYDEAEYSNVEGISVIEKNEKIDIEMIRELINKSQKPVVTKELPKVIEKVEPVIDDEKNYDIRDVLSKAKIERNDSDSKFANTQYNILKNISLNDEYDPKKLTEDDLKDMIETISNNSKISQTGDLFDDLRSICDPKMKAQIEEVSKPEEIDKSFYTNSMTFSKSDFEGFEDLEKNAKESNTFSKIAVTIIIIMLIVAVLLILNYVLGWNLI